MKENNPAFVPRNHLVEEALDAAVNGNLDLFRQLLAVESKPYHYREDWSHYTLPPPPDFEKDYATYCGT